MRQPDLYYFETIKITSIKSRSETITMPMICSLIEHGFLPVFLIERKVILYSNCFSNLTQWGKILNCSWGHLNSPNLIFLKVWQ